MTRLFVSAVLVSFAVPIQLPPVQPPAGAAVSWISSPAMYCPVEQPELSPGEAVGTVPPAGLLAARVSGKQVLGPPATTIGARACAALLSPCWTMTLAL